MSSVDAANTETITLVESHTADRQSPPAAASPTGQDTRQTDASSRVDGRSSDPDKMLESATVEWSEGDSSTDAAGPSNVDASQQQSVEANGTVADDQQQWSEEDGHDLKRVKVYELQGSRWVDQGTAFCFGDFNETQALLIARAETDFNKVILSTTIRCNDVYQRQQDTLIVWTEPTGVDYALSFQDPDGCEEVWNFIQEVQRHMATAEAGLSSSPLIGPEPSVTTASIIRSGHLPPPALGIISEIERAIKAIARTPQLKERVCEYIQSEDYIKQLVDVFKQAEDLESIDNLHSLCSCMQTILMLNDHSMYEHILEDEIFYGVVGMLEYDPEFPTHKANYREFLRQTSHFHQPVPIRDEAIQKKIHHTYRLQFLKDVVLARALDDSTFNVLNSCILFNQIDIINHVQNDAPFLREVVGIFLDEDMLVCLGLQSKDSQAAKATLDKNKMDVDQPEVKLNGSASFSNGISKPLLSEAELKRRREVISLLQQLCVMGKNVQLPARMALFRTLTDRGILFAVQWALAQPENDAEGLQMISAGGEILSAVLDHDITGVRTQLMRVVNAIADAESDKTAGKRPQVEPMVTLMCRVMTRSRNLAVQSLIAEALRVMLEIPQGEGADPHTAMGAKMFQRPKDDPVTEKFLEYFYKQCADILFNPVIDLTEFKNQTEGTLITSRERTNLYLHLCELLANFALQHSFRSHFFMLSSNIACHVGTLLSARDKHLRLAAFRFFRVLLKLSNRNLFNHLMKIDAFQPILDLTIRESRRDNLLSSTCKEFFEHMRKENMKELIHFCMSKHQDKVKTLADCNLMHDSFTAFIARWEMNMEPPPKEDLKDKATVTGLARKWNMARAAEVEEEAYFNDEEEEEQSGVNLGKTTPGMPPHKRRRMRGGSSPGMAIRPQQLRAPIQRTPTLGSLVDYEDNDESASTPSEDPQTPSMVFTMTGRAVSPAPQPQLPPSVSRLQSRPLPLKPAPRSPPLNGVVGVVTVQTPPTIVEELPLPVSAFSQAAEGGAGEHAQSKAVGSGQPDFPLSTKRRRDDDEDDELLEQLAFGAKPKRSPGASPLGSPGVGKEQSRTDSPGALASKLSSVRAQEESGPKRIKLKLSSPAPLIPSPSSTGVKDGDTG